MKTSFLAVTDLSVQKKSQILLKKVSFVLQSMEILSVVGASGSGKSVLIKTLLGIQPGDIAGEVKKIGLQRFGLVSQKYPSVAHLSLFQNLSLVSRLAGVELQAHLAEEVEEVLKTVGLWSDLKNRLHDPVESLSDFQKILINLSRTLLLKPSILILDQPTIGLDPLQKARYESVVERLKNTMSIIWINHDLEQVARVSDQVLFLVDGEMIECSSCEVFFTMPKEQQSEDFISRRVYV